MFGAMLLHILLLWVLSHLSRADCERNDARPDARLKPYSFGFARHGSLAISSGAEG